MKLIKLDNISHNESDWKNKACRLYTVVSIHKYITTVDNPIKDFVSPDTVTVYKTGRKLVIVLSGIGACKEKHYRFSIEAWYVGTTTSYINKYLEVIKDIISDSSKEDC